MELEQLKQEVKDLQAKIPQIEELRRRMFWNRLAYDIILILAILNLAVGVARLILR